mmetsp:Transcript_4318/g.9305  ORF Transcript_4318/g.9305 Transcript_4318/m.9305 type:complete len:277 (-) Transcript_4318:33-863(-)
MHRSTGAIGAEVRLGVLRPGRSRGCTRGDDRSLPPLADTASAGALSVTVSRRRGRRCMSAGPCCTGTATTGGARTSPHASESDGWDGSEVIRCPGASSSIRAALVGSSSSCEAGVGADGTGRTASPRASLIRWYAAAATVECSVGTTVSLPGGSPSPAASGFGCPTDIELLSNMLLEHVTECPLQDCRPAAISTSECLRQTPWAPQDMHRSSTRPWRPSHLPPIILTSSSSRPATTTRPQVSTTPSSMATKLPSPVRQIPFKRIPALAMRSPASSR